MECYNKEFKEKTALKRLIPLENMPIVKIAKELGVSDTTIRNWRSVAREECHAVPRTGKNAEKWRSSDKLFNDITVEIPKGKFL